MPNKSEKHRISEITDGYRNYRDSWQDLLETSEEAHDFFLGNQWKKEDLEALSKKGLPALTKNMILPVINRVSGMERMNRTDIIVTPAEGGFEDIAWAMTRLNYHFSRKRKLPHLFSQVFDIGIVGNMGAYIRPVYTTEIDPEGSIDYKVINGMNVLLDPQGRRLDLKDHTEIYYLDWWTKKRAMAFAPHKKKEIQNLSDYEPGLSGLVSRITRATTEKSVEKDMMERSGKYLMLERWKRIEKRDRFFFDPFEDKELRPKTQREREELLFRRPHVIERSRIDTRMEVTVLFAGEIELYHGPASIQSGRYPFFFFSPYYHNSETLGMVENLKDYNREHNKRSSSILHILNSTAQSGWLARKGSTDVDQLEVIGSALGPIIEYMGEAPVKIKPNSLPSGLAYTDQEAKQGIYETSGIGPNLLGRSETGRETGKLFDSRVDEGNIMLQGIFDNYSLCKQYMGDYQVWLYQNKFSAERIFQLLDEEKKPESARGNREIAEEIASNKNVGKYNVFSETVTHNMSSRKKLQQELGNLAKIMPPELVPWHEIIRAVDWPSDVKEKAAKYIETRLGIRDQAQQELLNRLANGGNVEEATSAVSNLSA